MTQGPGAGRKTPARVGEEEGRGPSWEREGRRGGPAPDRWGPSSPGTQLAGPSPHPRRSGLLTSPEGPRALPTSLSLPVASLPPDSSGTLRGAPLSRGPGAASGGLQRPGRAGSAGPRSSERSSCRFLPPPRPQPHPLPGAARESRALRSKRDLGILGRPGRAPRLRRDRPPSGWVYTLLNPLAPLGDSGWPQYSPPVPTQHFFNFPKSLCDSGKPISPVK